VPLTHAASRHRVFCRLDRFDHPRALDGAGVGDDGVARQREYLADASGAELTRNPMGLARALEKIDAAVAPTTSINQGTAHLCIADPLAGR